MSRKLGNVRLNNYLLHFQRVEDSERVRIAALGSEITPPSKQLLDQIAWARMHVEEAKKSVREDSETARFLAKIFWQLQKIAKK